jgi:hypothetical protein
MSDLLEIPARDRALAGVALYVGDGSSVDRPIQRLRSDILTGHAAVATQLEWCADAGIRSAIFTHCGTGPVTSPAEAARRLRALGAEHGVAARFAHDGLQYAIGAGVRRS